MKKFRIILMVICIVSTVTAIGLAVYNLYYNSRLRGGFRQKEYAHSYAEEIAKDEIDPQVICSMFPDISTQLGFDYQDDIASPAEIRYYADINDDTPIFVVKKGTVIHVDSGEILNGEYTFQGVNSLPSAKKGWRLVRPFASGGQKADDTLLYVKLTDLKQVISAWLEENPGALKGMRSFLIREGLLPTKTNASRKMLLSADSLLYREGRYLSEDLMVPVFSPEMIVCLCISACLLAAVLWGNHKSDR